MVVQAVMHARLHTAGGKVVETKRAVSREGFKDQVPSEPVRKCGLKEDTGDHHLRDDFA